MNITELARKLRINTKELKILLPELGFDVGRKAIKVDDKVADNIIKNWRRLLYEYRARLSLQEQTIKKDELDTSKDTPAKPVALPPQITVKTLAEKLNLPLSGIMKELMKNGIMVSLNEKIDFDTAAIIAEDLGKKIIPEEKTKTEEDNSSFNSVQNIIKKGAKKNFKSRPPIIVVMGHVDHGKTKLLDNLRKTNIADKESGGITQHIGAYQIEKNNRLLTFIDTPGHEAFTAMRTRGSRIADIAILVVAADDGVQPQTLEAIKIIKNAKLPMLIAINKIDKPEANVEKIKKELSEHNIISEEWGGEYIFVPISAKSGKNLDKLIDALLLITDMEKESLVTDWQRLPLGTIIESHVDSSEGNVATLLVQAGILKIGQFISINNTYYGRIRIMKDHTGKNIKQANPGTPVKILGLKGMPIIGDIIEIKDSEKKLNKKISTVSREQLTAPITTAGQTSDEEEDNKPGLKLILKTDTLGSSEAIIESLAKLNLPENFKIDIIHKALGNINDNDINRAETAKAILVGFHVNASPAMAELAKEKSVAIQIYSVIYELLDFLRDAILKISKPIIKHQEMGTIKIIKIFKKTKNGQIIGGLVTKGIIEPPITCNVIKNDLVVGEARIIEIQSGKEKVTNVSTGQECGLEIKSLLTIEPGNKLTAIKETEEKIKL